MLSSGATAVCEIDVVHALLVTCYSITPNLSLVYCVSQSWVLARLGLAGLTGDSPSWMVVGARVRLPLSLVWW